MLIGGWNATRDVRTLSNADRDAALALCARDPISNVYVAARILETDLDRARGALLGYAPNGALRSLLWASANLVPVACDGEAAGAFAAKVRRQEHQCSSVFGPSGAVQALWGELSALWHAPIDIRPRQPLMAIGPEQPLRHAPDPRVRVTRPDELDLVVPAAAAMFTEEIGYAPYADRASQAAYVNSVRTLIARGHSFVITESERVVFKADIGSAGVGACQIQGVWVDPAYRGRGITGPAMAAVIAHARARVAPLVTLYVNDYNVPALTAYQHVGMSIVGEFATVLL